MTSHSKGHCEAMLTRWGETSTGGMTVTFTLDAADFPAGHPFKGMSVGKGGERMMIAWQVIGPDEQPVEPAPAPEQAGGFDLATFNPDEHQGLRFDELSVGQQAAILCQDQEFWDFLTAHYSLGYTVRSKADAKRLLCEWFQVSSRKDIPADQWATLCQQYQQCRSQQWLRNQNAAVRA